MLRWMQLRNSFCNLCAFVSWLHCGWATWIPNKEMFCVFHFVLSCWEFVEQAAAHKQVSDSTFSGGGVIRRSINGPMGSTWPRWPPTWPLPCSSSSCWWCHGPSQPGRWAPSCCRCCSSTLPFILYGYFIWNMSPLLLQDCPGPPANGSLHGEPPVKVTLGYLTAVTGTMNNRQVNIGLNCLIDASTMYLKCKDLIWDIAMWWLFYWWLSSKIPQTNQGFADSSLFNVSLLKVKLKEGLQFMIMILVKTTMMTMS